VGGCATASHLPINFEEIRAINMVMVPAIYFIYRLYEERPYPRAPLAAGRAHRRAGGRALQPIVLVKALPVSWREGVIEQAVARGVLRSSDAPRMLYARQFPRASPTRASASTTRRAGASSGSSAASGPRTRCSTNLNELYGIARSGGGPFLQIVTMDVWDRARARWATLARSSNRRRDAAPRTSSASARSLRSLDAS
jgi:hypothetical protein